MGRSEPRPGDIYPQSTTHRPKITDKEECDHAKVDDETGPKQAAEDVVEDGRELEEDEEECSGGVGIAGRLSHCPVWAWRSIGHCTK